MRQAQQIDLSNIATKADLSELRAATKADLAEVRREMAEMKAKLIKRTGGLAFAMVGAIVTAQRLFPGGHP